MGKGVDEHYREREEGWRKGKRESKQKKQEGRDTERTRKRGGREGELDQLSTSGVYRS